MKKLLGILICLLFICVALMGTLAYASETAEIIHFMSPTALAVQDGMLYVADNVENGVGVIHYFDITGAPQLLKTLQLPTNISNISSADGVLYAVADNRVFKIELADDKVTELQLESSIGKVVDVAVYKDKLILFTQTGLHENGAGIMDTDTPNPITCVASGDYLYYLYGNNSNVAQRRKQTTGGGIYVDPNDQFNKNLNWINGLKAIGAFAWDNDEVAIFGENGIYYSVSAGSQYNLDVLITFNDIVIRDADMANDKLCVLTKNNQVKIFSKSGNTVTDMDITIGSDTLDQSVPTEYTSFTLVRSAGYPTNIVFKTTGDNSIDEIVTDATEYIIIGYEGDADSDYYYVLLGDEFGWVKKSDKLQVVDTSLTDGQFTATARFVSLNGVFVSPLPRQFYYNSTYSTTYTQSANDRIKVSVLQAFKEGNTTWYYVSFEQGGATHTGFVPESAIGEFTISGNLDGISVVGNYKVNAGFFSTVKVYDKSMSTYAYDENGKQIKLSSGTRVTVISIDDNGVAFIQIKQNNAYGYVDANSLIGEHQMTTNAIVGLVLLAVAIVLGVTLTVIFVRRKKKKQNNETIE